MFIFIWLLDFLLEFIHLIFVDMPMFFNKKYLVQNYIATFPQDLPQDLEERNLKQYDDIIILLLILLPFLFVIFGGFMAGYAPDIFGENGSLGQIPTFLDLIDKMYIYISIQIILYGKYIFLVLGSAFLILLINKKETAS